MNSPDLGLLLQLFVRDLPGFALVLLDVEGKVLTWSSGARALLGYSSSEIVGQPYAKLFIAADIESATPLALLANARASGAQSETVLRVRKDGAHLRMQSVLVPLRNQKQELLGFGNLMLAVGGVARTAAAQPNDAATTPSRLKILVVEDDEQVRTVAVDQLTSLGYEVIVAASGAEAIEILTRIGDIDLLFTDVIMPGGMNGREVAVEARKIRPGLKVLFTSGYFAVALVREGAIEADVQVLVKPYRKHALREKIREVLNSTDPVV